jgi:hypothetical protein
MIHDRVTPNDIARVVAKATGIPVQNLMKGVWTIQLSVAVVLIFFRRRRGWFM